MEDSTKAYLLGALRRLIVLTILGAIFWFGIMPFIHWLLTGPHPLLLGLQQHFVQHLAEYLSFIGVLSIAFVCTWPVMIPKTGQDWWTWFRDAFQTAIPASRARQESHSQSSTQTPNSLTTQEATATKTVDPQAPLAQPEEPANPSRE